MRLSTRHFFTLLIGLIGFVGNANSQRDTTTPAADTFFLLKYKGLLGKIAKNIIIDTNDTEKEVERNDRRFQRYRGRYIRNIIIRRVEFGTPLTDTSRKFTNTLIKLANNFHRQTRPYVVSNNLFFSKKDPLLPYLLADNERHLRNLPYINDARIEVRAVPGHRDSVDVTVLTKDVLSIGGSFSIGSLNRYEVSVKEDNFFGWGDRLQVKGLYDQERNTKMGLGIEYIRRNIAGTFIDGTIGYQNYSPTLNASRREEQSVYASLVKPLVNQYTNWTYALEGGYHSTQNMYIPDSLYKSDFKYSYYNADAWVSYNTGVSKKDPKLSDERLRTILGLRYLQQKFLTVPDRYAGSFYFRYADITAILGSISIVRQDFYKTRYVYGFGRNEDVPEGMDVSITTGWTKKQGRQRGYAGLDVQFNYFGRHDSYFNYTFRLGSFVRNKTYEDVDLLLNLDYFSNLRRLGRWRQRTFVSAGFTSQFGKTLNEPLFLQSNYGLPEYRNDSLFGGELRATLKAESVFFTHWSLLSFRFAPFIFANGTWIDGNSPPTIRRNLYTSIGGGLRSRNESLIFGTLEFKTFFFPGRNFLNEYFRFEFSTNVRFKYNEQIIKRPEFVVVN